MLRRKKTADSPEYYLTELSLTELARFLLVRRLDAYFPPRSGAMVVPECSQTKYARVKNDEVISSAGDWGAVMLLRVLKPRRATLSPMSGLREKLKRWWMTMTDDEQRDIFVRGATIAVCAVAATVTLPMVGQIQAEKRADADFREQAVRLASMEDGGVTVRSAAYTPSLLDTPWMRTVEYTLERDTGSSMSRYAMRDRDGAALNSLVSFRPEHIKRAETISAEQKCLAQAVYYESAHEPLGGQVAVAEVIANRMADHRYPDTACGVVFQGATRTTGCQFTFTCDGALKTPPMGRNWERAKTIAAHVLMNLNVDSTGGATHYHATYVDPIWSAGLIKTDKIGMHIFYRFPRGSEWASVRQGYKAKRAEVQLASLSADEEIVAPVDGAATSYIQTVEAPTVAPATVTVSDRTITNGAPRLTTIKSVDYEEPQLKSTGNADAVAAYMAKQTGITVASNDRDPSVMQ